MPVVASPRATNFYVRDYGAYGDGVTDEAVAVQRAVTAASAAGGGKVVFPHGTFIIGTAITIPSNVTLEGAGRRATFLKKPSSASTNVILEIDGTDPVGLVERVSVRDLCLNGNDSSVPVLRSYYGSAMDFMNVDTVAVTGDAWDMVQAWDCRYWNCRWINTAEATTQCASIRFRNSAASSGFGYSGDNSNEHRFFGCVWETFKGHAVWIEEGTNNNETPNGFTFMSCKWETVHARREIIYVDVNTNVQRIRVIDGYFAVLNLDSGASAIDMVRGGIHDQYIGVWATVGTAGTVNSVFRVDAGGVHRFESIVATGQALNTAVVNVVGGNGTVRVGSITGSAPDAVKLTGGLSVIAGDETIMVSGAGKTSVADADFTGGGLMVVPGVSKILAKNTSDGSYRLFVRTETTAWKGVVVA